MISPTTKLRVILALWVILVPETMALAPPDTKNCCRRGGVSEFCVDVMCDFHRPPNDFQVYTIPESCGEFLSTISQCLADDRDHTPCCRSEAADSDLDACFDICSGSARPLNESHWDEYRNYMACLSLNIRSMFNCFDNGYQHSPTSPREVASDVRSPTSVLIRWKMPERFQELTKKYILFYGPVAESESGNQEVLRIETDQTVFRLSSLNPDTRYFAYVVSVSENGKFISMKSKRTIFVTQGVAPNVTAYRPTVYGSVRGMKTLVCRVHVRGLEHRHLQVVWQKQTADTGRFFTLQREETGKKKYALVAYLTAHRPHIGQPRAYVSALSVRELELEDFRLYRCIARNQFGSGSADVSLQKLTDMRVPAGPPNITDCCISAGVSSDCLGGCQSFGGQPHDASLYIPNQMCALDTPKILSCSMKGVDLGACCLRRKVPFHCLPFCDGTVDFPLSLPMYSCLMHTTDILTCHLEAKAILPEVPQKLKISKQDNHSATVRWMPARRATLYHVYYRLRHSADWDRKTVTATEARLGNLGTNSIYEVVLTAANSEGISDSSRILYLLTGNLLRDAPNLDSETPDSGLRGPRPASGRMEETLAQN